MSCIGRGTLVALAVATVLAPAPSQATPPPVLEPVDGAGAVAVGVLWGREAPGGRHDAGIATILAHCRADRARARAPGVAVTVHVDGGVACIVGVAPAGDGDRLATFAAALLDDLAPLDDDTIALATARAALRADDERCLLPGGLLAARARAALGSAQKPVGRAERMLAEPPERVRARLREPVGTAVAARGAIDAGLAERLRRLPRAEGLARPATPATPAPAPPPDRALRAVETHARVDQPFVMAAFRVPAAPDLPAFAVALEVARARAAARLPLRGSEPRAGTPLVAWSWPAGDDVVCFHRRGAAPVDLLPGEVAAAGAEAEAEATRAELEALLDDLRRNPPAEREVSAARTRLRAEAGLAPPTVATCDRAVLGGQLRAAMLARHRGIEPGAVDAVTPARAGAVLAAALDPAGACWHTLLPRPRSDHGWLRR